MLRGLCSDPEPTTVSFLSSSLFSYTSLRTLFYPVPFHDNAKECDTPINVKLYWWAHPLEIEMRQGTLFTQSTKGILCLFVHLPRFPPSKLEQTLLGNLLSVCSAGESQCSWARSLCLQFCSGGTRSSVLFLQEYMLVFLHPKILKY